LDASKIIIHSLNAIPWKNLKSWEDDNLKINFLTFLKSLIKMLRKKDLDSHKPLVAELVSTLWSTHVQMARNSELNDVALSILQLLEHLHVPIFAFIQVISK
jgi:hypothetical protein